MRNYILPGEIFFLIRCQFDDNSFTTYRLNDFSFDDKNGSKFLSFYSHKSLRLCKIDLSDVASLIIRPMKCSVKNKIFWS